MPCMDRFDKWRAIFVLFNGIVGLTAFSVLLATQLSSTPIFAGLAITGSFVLLAWGSMRFAKWERSKFVPIGTLMLSVPNVVSQNGRLIGKMFAVGGLVFIPIYLLGLITGAYFLANHWLQTGETTDRELCSVMTVILSMAGVFNGTIIPLYEKSGWRPATLHFTDKGFQQNMDFFAWENVKSAQVRCEHKMSIFRSRVYNKKSRLGMDLAFELPSSNYDEEISSLLKEFLISATVLAGEPHKRTN